MSEHLKALQPAVVSTLVVLCLYLTITSRNNAQSFHRALVDWNKLHGRGASSEALEVVGAASKAVTVASASAATLHAAATQAGAGEAADQASSAAAGIGTELKDAFAQLQSSALAVQSAAIALQSAVQTLPPSSRLRVPGPVSLHGTTNSVAALSAVSSSTSLKRTFYDYTQVVTDVYSKHGFTISPCPAPDTECWLPLSKTVNCTVLFTSYLMQMASHTPVSPAPKTMPAELRDEYLLNGAVQAEQLYFSNVDADNGKGAFKVWSQQYLDDMTALARNRPPKLGAYGANVKAMYHALDCHPVKGLHGAVIGSRTPWVEAVLLAFGASKLTTIEYARLVSQVHNLDTLTPKEWSERWLNNTLPEPDFLASFSSLEHDGLARYGDPFNPWGDVESMQRLSCYVKAGGLLFLDVPSSTPDRLFWNAHRAYGPVRYPLLTANWKVLNVFSLDKEMSGCANKCGAFWNYVESKLAAGNRKYLGTTVLVVLENQRSADCNQR